MEAPGAREHLSSTAEGGEPRGLRLLSGLLIVGAVLVVFGRSYGYPFLRWDDPTAVTENPLLHPPSWRNLAAIWSAPWT